MEKKDKIVITLGMLNLLTMLGALLFLNRFGKIIFEFHGRTFVEHFLTGFYFPLAIMFIFYVAINVCSLINSNELSNFDKKSNIRLLILYSLIIFLFEIWWQFFVNFNAESIAQMIYLIIGIFCLWFYIIKMKLF